MLGAGEGAVEVGEPRRHPVRPGASTNASSASRAHSGRDAPLLVDRHALGQPARHALLRELQREDVGQLVPQRRLPAEGARRPRARRVERHDAAEAGAERADQARAGPACAPRSRRASGRSRRASARAAPNCTAGESAATASSTIGSAYCRSTGASAGCRRDDGLARAERHERVERVEQARAGCR